MQINLRSLSAKLIKKVIEDKVSLTFLLKNKKYNLVLSRKDYALVQEICFGVMRFMPYLELLVKKLIYYSFSKKNRILHYLLLVGIYQLYFMRIPPYAIISETVEGASILNRKKLKSLINAILRKFQRKQILLDKMLKNEFLLTKHLHPNWLFKRIKISWPNNYKQIIKANNSHPPMWLRINRQYISRDEWIKIFNKKTYLSNDAPDALRLFSAKSVNQLPGFNKGWITIQDLSSQRCVIFLDPNNYEEILDVCAAPGVKTTHILEVAPYAKVTSVDINANRILKIQENLKRLNMNVNIIKGDGCKPHEWCKTKYFDRILLDVPCSGTGVIRRHPDIKWIRSNKDIKNLINIQKKLLNANWKLLKAGGILLYTTCSILPEENHLQIKSFINKNSDANIEQISKNFNEFGLQVLPEIDGGDGFFYAKLRKNDLFKS